MDYFLKKKKKGFTLVEIMVALFIFVLLMAAVSQIFTSAFSSYRSARVVQKDLQNAQFTLNSMAKMLRTSTIVSGESSGAQSIKFFDYSQGEDGLCIEYQIADNTLSVANAEAQDPDQCEEDITFASSNFVPLTGGNVSGVFVVTPSRGDASKRVGKVTISLRIQEGPNHVARIQSSTSLRDYGNVDW